MEQAFEDRIRQHAYFLWLDSGGAGDPNYFWLTAELDVLAEVGMESATDFQHTGASGESAAHRLARRVNALVLLESVPDPEAAEAALAAE